MRAAGFGGTFVAVALFGATFVAAAFAGATFFAAVFFFRGVFVAATFFGAIFFRGVVLSTVFLTATFFRPPFLMAAAFRTARLEAVLAAALLGAGFRAAAFFAGARRGTGLLGLAAFEAALPAFFFGFAVARVLAADGRAFGVGFLAPVRFVEAAARRGAVFAAGALRLAMTTSFRLP